MAGKVKSTPPPHATTNEYVPQIAIVFLKPGVTGDQVLPSREEKISPIFLDKFVQVINHLDPVQQALL
jgi:hypothetical protein